MSIMVDAGCKLLPKNKVIGYYVSDDDYIVGKKTGKRMGRVYYRNGEITQLVCPKYPKCKKNCLKNAFVRIKRGAKDERENKV